MTYNDNEFTNSATTKLLYPPISRITYEQLRIPTSRLEYYAHFTNAIQECRWQDTDTSTIIPSRNFQGWPIRHLFQRNINSSQTNYYARTKFYASYCVSVTSQKLIVNCYNHERLGNQSFLMWKAFDAFLTTVFAVKETHHRQINNKIQF